MDALKEKAEGILKDLAFEGSVFIRGIGDVSYLEILVTTIPPELSKTDIAFDIGLCMGKLGRFNQFRLVI